MDLYFTGLWWEHLLPVRFAQIFEKSGIRLLLAAAFMAVLVWAFDNYAGLEASPDPWLRPFLIGSAVILLFFVILRNRRLCRAHFIVLEGNQLRPSIHDINTNQHKDEFFFALYTYEPESSKLLHDAQASKPRWLTSLPTQVPFWNGAFDSPITNEEQLLWSLVRHVVMIYAGEIETERENSEGAEEEKVATTRDETSFFSKLTSVRWYLTYKIHLTQIKLFTALLAATLLAPPILSMVKQHGEHIASEAAERTHQTIHPEHPEIPVAFVFGSLAIVWALYSIHLGREQMRSLRRWDQAAIQNRYPVAVPIHAFTQAANAWVERDPDGIEVQITKLGHDQPKVFELAHVILLTTYFELLHLLH
jgi:hypothetical protein